MKLINDLTATIEVQRKKLLEDKKKLYDKYVVHEEVGDQISTIHYIRPTLAPESGYLSCFRSNLRVDLLKNIGQDVAEIEPQPPAPPVEQPIVELPSIQTTAMGTTLAIGALASVTADRIKREMRKGISLQTAILAILTTLLETGVLNALLQVKTIGAEKELEITKEEWEAQKAIEAFIPTI